MFSYVSLEQRVPQDHPLRAVRKLTDAVLRNLSPEFDVLYPSPQILQTDRCFCHFTPASLCRAEYLPVRALPSEPVLLHVHQR